MNVELTLLKEHSKNQSMKIVKWVGDDPARFAELMRCFMDKNALLVQRAAMPVGYAGIEHPELLGPWHAKLIAYLEKDGTHPAVRRNILRIYQFTAVPKRLQGKLVNLCFHFLTSNSEPVAIKAFSMTILKEIAIENPDLKNELISVVEQMLPYASAGITSRAKCLLLDDVLHLRFILVHFYQLNVKHQPGVWRNNTRNALWTIT